MIVDLSNITSGFSDKLRAITFYIAINNLKSKNKSKVFFIYEKKTKECPFRFIDYCEIKNIKIIKLKKKKISNLKLNSYNTEIKLNNVVANNPYKKIDNIALFKEWQNSYKKILPGKEIRKKIKNNKLSRNFIGLHLRTTDRTLNFRNILNIQFKDAIFNFQLDFFEKNIAKILEKNSKLRNVYIASDSKDIKENIIKILKKKKFKVYYNNSVYKKRFRETSGKDFLIDFFSLLQSKIILSTVGAGVTQSICLIKKIKIINWNNQLNRFILIRVMALIIILLKKLKNKFNSINSD